MCRPRARPAVDHSAAERAGRQHRPALARVHRGPAAARVPVRVGERAMGELGGLEGQSSPPSCASASRRRARASGSPAARWSTWPAMMKPTLEYSPSSVRGPGRGARATYSRPVIRLRGPMKSSGSRVPAVCPRRSRTVARRSPRQAGYQRVIGSSSRSLPRSTKRSASTAVATLVTLSKASEVSGVIACRGFTTASPAAPRHMRPSGKTIAADAPGMPASATPSRRRASSACATPAS